MRVSTPRQFVILLGVLVFTLQIPAFVCAGPNLDGRILVHLTTPVAKNTCDLRSNPPGCSSIETRGLVDVNYFAYVIFSHVSPTFGLSGARFGITYDGTPGNGVEVQSWTACAALGEFPVGNWPEAGSAIGLSWDPSDPTACQPPVVSNYAMAVGGYFHLIAFTPDEFRVVPHPQNSSATFSDCRGEIDVVTCGVVNPFGWATFSTDGTASGSEPCGLDNGGCHLTGPTFVDTGQTGIQYLMDPLEVIPTGSWSITGEGQITSSDNTSATVTAASPGTYWIRYDRAPDCVEGCGCSLLVYVLGPIPAQETTWGRIKATYAGTKPE